MPLILASKLNGKTVVARDGTIVGEVEDVEVDPKTWRVTAIVVDARRDLLEKLHVDQPVIAGGRSLMLSPEHIDSVTDRIHVTDDVWDIGRMRFQ